NEMLDRRGGIRRLGSRRWGEHRVAGLVAGRHCRLDLAVGRYILGTYDILGAGRCRRHRWRHDPLDARQEASGTIERHLVARAVEESGEQRLLGTDEIRDSRFDPGLADQVVDVDGAVL